MSPPTPRGSKKAWMQAAHQAIVELAPERLSVLLETAPADWDERVVEGSTLLGFAVGRYDFDDACLSVLLQAGADPDRPLKRASRNSYVEAPLRPWELALRQSSSRRLKMLLGAGAQPKLPAHSWRTNPLLTIRQWRDVDLLDTALARKWWSSYENILTEVLKWPEEVRAPRLEALLEQGQQPDVSTWKEAWWRWASEGTPQARQWVERFWPPAEQLPPVGWSHIVAFAGAHGDADLTQFQELIEQRVPPTQLQQWAPSLTLWKADKGEAALYTERPSRWGQRLALINWALAWGSDPNELSAEKVPALLLVLRDAADSAKDSWNADRQDVHVGGWMCVEALLLAGASLRKSAPYVRPSYTSALKAADRHLNVQAFFQSEIMGHASSGLERWRPRLEACLSQCRRQKSLAKMLGQGAQGRSRAPRPSM